MPQNLDFLRGLTKDLRAANDDITREPLPRRWVDLLLYLNEKEQKETEAKKRSA